MAKKVAAVANKKVEAVQAETAVAKKPASVKYWESAPDIEVRTEKGSGVRVWIAADKLQVQQDRWTNKATGEECPGKCVAVSLSELVAVLKKDKAVVKAVVSLLK